MRHFPSVAAVALGAVATAIVPVASAQTTASVGPSMEQFPHRFINGRDVGQSTRPQNLTPLGINFSDCVSDMELDFRAIVTLNPGDTVQVWATSSADCTLSSSRGSGGQEATCWRLNANLGPLVLTNAAEPFRVRVQDILGGQATVGQDPNTPVSFGREACTFQSSPAATTFNVFLMAIQPDGITVDGNAWNYQLPVDVVGPAPPALDTPETGDSSLVVSWTPNNDSDTGGYDVFVDPPPGTNVTPDTSSDAAAQTTLVCPDSGSDASDTDAMAACRLETVPPANGQSACTSTVLATSSTTIDSGTTSPTTPATDAGDDAAVATEPSNGGFTTITCDFLVGTSCPAGQPAYTATNTTVTGESSAGYTVKGLTNGVNYNVSVAAVDNFGNIGPLAPQGCQVPQPVTDFFEAYRGAGGLAGGGICSIDAVGRSARWGGCFTVFGLVVMSLFRRRSSTK